jgi:hypothetical protein
VELDEEPMNVIKELGWIGEESMQRWRERGRRSVLARSERSTSKCASKQTRNERGRAKFKNGADRAPPWLGRTSTLVGPIELHFFPRPNKS